MDELPPPFTDFLFGGGGWGAGDPKKKQTPKAYRSVGTSDATFFFFFSLPLPSMRQTTGVTSLIILLDWGPSNNTRRGFLPTTFLSPPFGYAQNEGSFFSGISERPFQPDFLSWSLLFGFFTLDSNLKLPALPLLSSIVGSPFWKDSLFFVGRTQPLPFPYSSGVKRISSVPSISSTISRGPFPQRLRDHRLPSFFLSPETAPLFPPPFFFGYASRNHSFFPLPPRLFAPPKDLAVPRTETFPAIPPSLHLPPPSPPLRSR